MNPHQKEKSQHHQWILPPEWVNDAVWAWNSQPYFMGDLPGTEGHFIHPVHYFENSTINGLSKEPVPVNSLRIGRLFEFYTSECLHLLLHPDPVYAGIQVMKKKDTAGELDFLFQWKGEWIHLEIAIKFYASASGSSHWSDWIGPSMRDSLDQKMEKMLLRQLPLATLPETQETIFSLTGGKPVKTLAWLTGWLFVHVSFLGKADIPLPVNANQAVSMGYWMSSGERPEVVINALEFRILTRPNWLTGQLPGFSESFRTMEDWMKRIKARLHGELYPAELTEVLLPDGKILRLFVFHPAWPGKR